MPILSTGLYKTKPTYLGVRVNQMLLTTPLPLNSDIVSTRWPYLGALTKVVMHFSHDVYHVSPLCFILMENI